MSKIENALVWLYVKTWGLQGQHVIDEGLWNFTEKDLDTVIFGISYPKKTNKNVKNEDEKISLDEQLKSSIMEKFDDDQTEFYKWSRSIYDEVVF